MTTFTDALMEFKTIMFILFDGLFVKVAATSFILWCLSKNTATKDAATKPCNATYLVPELQQFVDTGKMKMLPAYELSFLNEEAQRDIVDRIDETESFPSHAQARRMRKAFEEGKLNYDTVTEIMAEVKPNQVEKLKIPMDDIKKYAPDCSTPKELSDFIIKLMKQDYERKYRDRDDCR